MRLKQLLGIILLLIVTVASAAAASQLANISAAAQGNTTIITLRASGAFTHTEYRPVDNLLLVDLSGVSAGKLPEQPQAVNLPGVISYRVQNYKGSTGTDVARVEFTLGPNAVVHVAEFKDSLQVRVGTGEEPSSGAMLKTASLTSEAQPALQAKATPETKAAAKTKAAANSFADAVRVTSMGMVHADGGMQLEIVGSGPMSTRTQRVNNPDRFVIDLENAIPTGQVSPILVNGYGMKAVRIAQYQANPPVARVVMDLLASNDFDVRSEGNKVIVRPRMGSNTSVAHTTPTLTPAAAAPAPAVAQEKPAVTQNNTVAKAVEPKVEAKPVAKAVEAKAETKPVAMKAAEPKPESKPVAVKAPKVEARPVAQSAQPKPETKPQAEPKAAEPVLMASAATPAPMQATASVPAASAVPSDVVMVEPKYTAKAEVKPEAAAPRTDQAATVIAQNTLAAMPTPDPGMLPPQNAAPAQNAAAQQKQQRAAAAAASTTPGGSRYTGEPISVNLKDVDLKDFFRLIHEISGLNIVVDPAVKGSLTLVLDDVPWDQALDIVLQNNGLDRKLEGNVLRIAANDTFRKEAEDRRARAEAQALAVDKITVTHFLSYAHAKDVVPTVKKFLSARGDVIADERVNAIIIQDIPQVLPEVQRILTQLDRKTQEVEIEARVVAATRSFARDIGTQLGFGWGNGATALGGSVGQSPNSPGYVFPPPYFTIPGVKSPDVSQLQPGQPIPTTPASIPLFSNLAAPGPTSALNFFNIGRDYRLDFILTMAEQRGLLKVLSRPKVVTQNNIAATVRQGVRIPVVTQAQLGGPPTTTYIDAFLRLQVTPQITSENTIFLNVEVENTTPDFSRQVQGNPTLITQQATTQVLVTDGGTVVIGGVIQTQNSVNVQQVPLLGSIPVLGNLFKRRAVNTSTQELIFFVTPKIVQT